jgi:hypothetical protein
MNSALVSARLSQLRTVETATPSSAEMVRRPSPATLAASAWPMTSAASRRRSSSELGNSTWVDRQERQQARRSRILIGPLRVRTHRTDPHPHGLSSPQHPPQSRAPPSAAPRLAQDRRPPQARHHLQSMGSTLSGPVRRGKGPTRVGDPGVGKDPLSIGLGCQSREKRAANQCSWRSR